jgi:tetratricopeptide (TPR) repeat protein
VVVLGESAAQGIPVPTFGFATLLRAQLRACYPDKNIEVLNTGIVAINSHVVDRVAHDLAAIQPDAFVVYMGNNEVVGPYGPGCTYLPETPPRAVIRASVFVRSTRVGQAVSWLLAKLASHRAPVAEWGGMAMFVQNAVRGDDPRLEAVYRNYEANLRDIVSVAKGAGAKVLLCTMVSNLKDCPPLLSVHRPGLSPDQLKQWEAAFAEGRLEWKLGNYPKAAPALQAAEQVDPSYADVPYMLGDIALKNGSVDQARQKFVAAEHWDALRFRADPRINEIIRRVAAEGGPEVHLLDSARQMGSDPGSTGPIAGREILFEHVHFDWPGNVLLARTMAKELAGFFAPGRPVDSWLLDSDRVAADVAYTPHERLPLLLRIEVLVRKPPFSNQLTYVEDEARLAREIAAAGASSRSPANLARASIVANAAIAKDPNNPLLAGILEGIDLDLGDLPGALGQATRAQMLLPKDVALDADVASILQRLGKGDQAEQILLQADRSGADLDLLAPAYADFFSREKRYSDALQFIDQALLKHKGDRRLQLVRASVLRVSGYFLDARNAYQAILMADPSNEDALEGLVAALDASGETAIRDEMVLHFERLQQRNQANNLRALRLHEKANEMLGQKSDEPGAIRAMIAAERSGPVTSTFELTLALKLYRAERMTEMMDHLAEARLLSLDEGNPSVTASLEALIQRMEREIAASGPKS